LERDLEVLDEGSQPDSPQKLPVGKSPLPAPMPGAVPTPPVPEPEAEAALPESIPVEDPQLKRAVEVLQEKISSAGERPKEKSAKN
jgi:hypothetical protein